MFFSLNLVECLHLVLSSDLVLISPLPPFMISNFSVRHREQDLLPQAYGLHCFDISHLISGLLFASSSSQKYDDNLVVWRLFWILKVDL